MAIKECWGYLRYKLGTNAQPLTTIPTDIINSVAIYVKIDYNWEDRGGCTVSSLTWKPVIINANGTITDTGLQSDEFKQSNKLKIQLGTTTLVSTSDNNNSKLSNPTIYPSDTIGGSTTAQYLEFTFNYSYTQNNVEYLVDIKTKIIKASKYKNNVIFTKDGLDELLDNIKRYPVINIEEVNAADWATVSGGQPSIKITHGNPNFNGSNHNYKYVKVGNNIKFINPSNDQEITSEASGTQQTGTFRVKINNKTYEVPIKGLTGSGGTFSITASSANKLVQTNGTAYAVGGATNPIYFEGGIPKACSSTVGEAANPVYMKNGVITACKGNIGTTTRPVYIDSNGTITPCGFTIGTSVPANAVFTDTNTATAKDNVLEGTNSGTQITYAPYGTQQAKLSFDTSSSTPTRTDRLNLNGYFYATRVYNAVFNDYAECRTTIDLTPGHVVVDNDNGLLSCSSARLQPGAQVISDTYGSSMGETETAKTHIAVAGRVLVYTYQSRENYHAGMAVCSAPDGTVDIMTREEIRDYPDCIVGIVSEIPQYETWGSDNVKVDGRIWIKVK